MPHSPCKTAVFCFRVYPRNTFCSAPLSLFISALGSFLFYAPKAMLHTEQKNFLGDFPTWMTALGTLLLAAAAIFQDYFRSLVWKTKLELHIQPSPPDFHLTSMGYAYRTLSPQGLPLVPKAI